MPKYHVLVTGPTFITQRHEELLSGCSVELTRLPDVAATEEQLIAAVAGKDGYILGGLERITAPVIHAAKQLRAICFTGAGWTEFVPAHGEATRRGIAITAAPGANAQAVAELAVGLVHERIRNITYLASEGSGERIRGRNLRSLTLGIVGAGNIGSKVARVINGAYGTRIIYNAPRRNLDLEYTTGARAVTLDELLSNSDVVSLHMRKSPATTGLIDATRLEMMSDGAVLINTAFADAVEPHALFAELSTGRLSAALDVVFQHVEADMPDFGGLSSRALLQMGVQSGFNTSETVEVASDIATQAMIDLLETGSSSGVVNPTFTEHLRADT